MFDEIHVSQRPEYSDGKFVGLVSIDESFQPAKTVLCFMLNSLASKFREIVALFPIANINVMTLKNCFFSVVWTVEACGYEVILTCSDNHVVNRNFFTFVLCGNQLAPYVTHPLDQERKLFIMLDPTHNIKNAYNNFHNKKKFTCPSFSEANREIHPNFQHVEDLFLKESSKPLRLAHKLTQASIYPTNIQKTSAKLSLCFSRVDL